MAEKKSRGPESKIGISRTEVVVDADQLPYFLKLMGLDQYDQTDYGGKINCWRDKVFKGVDKYGAYDAKVTKKIRVDEGKIVNSWISLDFSVGESGLTAVRLIYDNVIGINLGGMNRDRLEVYSTKQIWPLGGEMKLHKMTWEKGTGVRDELVSENIILDWGDDY